MSEAGTAPDSAPEAVTAAVSAVLEALNATDSNGTETLNATAKFVATAEGTALAYGSLVFMALLPIFFGALRSVDCSKSKVSDTATGCHDTVVAASLSTANAQRTAETNVLVKIPVCLVFFKLIKFSMRQKVQMRR